MRYAMDSALSATGLVSRKKPRMQWIDASLASRALFDVQARF